jgi:hypothetical protein
MILSEPRFRRGRSISYFDKIPRTSSSNGNRRLQKRRSNWVLIKAKFLPISDHTPATQDRKQQKFIFQLQPRTVFTMPPKKATEKKGGWVYAKELSQKEKEVQEAGFPWVSISHIKK